MTNLYRQSNVAPTALTSGCAATGSITLVSNVGLTTARFPYKLLIDWGSFVPGATQEAVYITGLPSGSPGAWTFPCIRGVDGTGPSANTGTTHIGGAPVEPGVTQEDYGAVDWINVTSYPFGADPVDGADSTLALNNAASAAYGSNIASGTLSVGLYIPSGLYVTSAPWVIPPGVPVMTDFSEEVTTYVDGYWGTVIQPSAGWAPTTVGSNTYYGVVTMLGQTVPSPNYATASVEQKINGLYIDCHLVPGGTTMNGVQMYGNVQRAHLWRVCVSHCPGNCFDMVNDVSGNGPDAPRFERCTARNGAAIGFNHIKISDASYFDCLAESCAGDGFHIQNASNGLLMACRSEHNGTAGVGNGYTYVCSSDSTGSGGFKMVGCSSDRNEGYGLAISSSNNTGVPISVTGCNFRRDGRNSNTGGGGLAGIYVTAFPGLGGGTPSAVVELAGTNVFTGVDDNGSGTNSPQYGLKVASNNLGYVVAAACHFQGNTAGISDDGSSAQPVAYAACTQASGSTTAPTVTTLKLGPPWASQSLLFGNGSDGAVTLDGTVTVPWASKVGSVYTLTRNVQLTSLAINSGVTLKPFNFLIFIQGALTGAGTIDYSGASASGSSAGASIGNSTSLMSNPGGGAGGTGVSGAGAAGTARNFGPAGGAGGNGTSGAGGSAATPAQAAAALLSNVLVTPFPLLSNIVNYASGTLNLSWGAGGSGGGSDASSNAGGGGGAGGGEIVIFAWSINFTGTISANGGAGGNTAASGNPGGGGGGTGGLIVLVTLATASVTTTSVTGGALGTGHGTGANGTAGSAGSVVNLVLA